MNRDYMKRAELASAMGMSPEEADRIGEASGARIYNPGFQCFVYDVDKVKAYMLTQGSRLGGKIGDKIQKAQERSGALKARIMSNRQHKFICGLSADDLTKINQNRKKTEVRRNGKKCN